MECEGFNKKLMLVLLLLADKEMDGEVGGSMPLLRDRIGDGYETVSETEGWSIGEYAKRSWAATVDKASRPCDSPSPALEPLPHLLFRA